MSISRSFAVLAFFLLAAASANAQTDPNLEQGIKPYGGYDSTDFDSVSMVNGGLTIKIPLFSYPQRGKDLTLNLQLEYMSSGWGGSYIPPAPPKMTNLTFNGFKFDEDQRFYVDIGCVGAYAGLIKSPAVIAHDGASHQLGETSVNQPHTVFGFESLDATGLKLSNFQYSSTTMVPGVITDRAGIQYTPTGFPSTLAWHGNYLPSYSKEDPNGNEITYNNLGSGWTDTLGRQIPVPPGLGGNITTDTTGCAGLFPITSAYLWTLPGPEGGSTQLKACFANIVLQTNFISSTEEDTPCCEMSMMQTVIVYNGSSWSTSPAWIFEYNDRAPGDPSSVNYLSLTKVTFPTGGTITYTYTTLNPITSPGAVGYTRAVATKTVNANDGTGNHTWNYSYSFSGYVGTNTVTDPLGNATVYIETSLGTSHVSYYPTQVNYYTGSHSSGTLLKYVKTSYSYAAPTTDNACRTDTSVVPVSVTTIWANNQQAETITGYDSGFSFTDGSGVNFSAIYGLPTTKQDYDYGSSAPGSLDRTGFFIPTLG